MYLLIETGYEGIEELCYLSASVDEIKQKRLEFIDIKHKYYQDLWKDSELTTPEYDPDSDKYLYTRKYIADFFCIQKWNGEAFDCACKELDVSPSKYMHF